MKKYALFAAAALVALAACSKTEVKPQTPEPPVDENSPVAVQFGVSSADATISTKAVGPVDDSWNGKQTLYVYSFAKAAEALDYTTAVPFIDNISASSPASGASGKIDVLNPNPDGKGTPGQTPEPFYYNNDLIYDFYGYHMDDAWADGTAVDDYMSFTVDADNPVPVKKEAGRIYIPFLINGSQDLMVAKADAQTDFAKATDDTFKGEATNVQYVYSAYAARRGVQPTLTFQHVLARFNFRVLTGGSDADELMVESVAIESRYKGNLVVVANMTGTEPDLTDSRGLGELSEDVTDLFLQEYSASGDLQAFTPYQIPEYDAETTTNNVAQPIGNGSSILAVPDVESYTLTVNLKYNDTASETHTTPVEPIVMSLNAKALMNGSDPANATEFEAGKEYNVTIKVIGPKEVQITADLNPWTPGGEVVIDPDQPPTVPGADDEEQGGGTTPEPEPGA